MDEISEEQALIFSVAIGLSPHTCCCICGDLFKLEDEIVVYAIHQNGPTEYSHKQCFDTKAVDYGNQKSVSVAFHRNPT